MNYWREWVSVFLFFSASAKSNKFYLLLRTTLRQGPRLSFSRSLMDFSLSFSLSCFFFQDKLFALTNLRCFFLSTPTERLESSRQNGNYIQKLILNNFFSRSVCLFWFRRRTRSTAVDVVLLRAKRCILHFDCLICFSLSLTQHTRQSWYCF